VYVSEFKIIKLLPKTARHNNGGQALGGNGYFRYWLLVIGY